MQQCTYFFFASVCFRALSELTGFNFLSWHLVRLADVIWGTCPEVAGKTFRVCQIRNAYKRSPLFSVFELLKRVCSKQVSRNLTTWEAWSLTAENRGIPQISSYLFSPPTDKIFIAQQLQKGKACCIPNSKFPWHGVREQQNYQAILMRQVVIIYICCERCTSTICGAH